MSGPESDKPVDEPDDAEHPGLPTSGGIVDEERDVSDKPQADPEIPALGESDPDRDRIKQRPA